MSLIRKSRYFLIPFLLTAFIFFTQQVAGLGVERLSPKSGEAIKLVPGNACTKDFLDPSLNRLHFQVFPSLKGLFESSASVDPAANFSQGENGIKDTCLSHPALCGAFILRYICKFQI